MRCPCCEKEVDGRSPYCVHCGVKYGSWSPLGELGQKPPPRPPLHRRLFGYIPFRVLALVALGYFWYRWGARMASFGYSNVLLETVESGDKSSWTECPTQKCLVVYLAPRNPPSSKAIPYIMELRDRLEERHIGVRIVVGMGDFKADKELGLQFGYDTYLDPENKLELRGVLPHCFVIDSKGKILRDFEGFPYGPEQTAMDEAQWTVDVQKKFGVF